MGIQHQLGADIIFAFDELTTLVNTRGYQSSRCVAPMTGRPAAWPNTGASRSNGRTSRTRRCSVWCRARSTRTCRAATRGLVDLRDEDGRGFDGYGIGGALEKQNLATIVGWVIEELPDDKPRICSASASRRPVRRGGRRCRHLRLRVAVAGRPQRRGVLGDRAVQHHRRAPQTRLHPIDAECDCYTCANYTRALPAPPVQGQGDPGPRCAPSTTSGSSSGSSTGSAPRSAPASSTSCVSTSWAGTTRPSRRAHESDRRIRTGRTAGTADAAARSGQPADPYPLYAQIRERGPLAAAGRIWSCFSGFAACDEVLRHPFAASDRLKSTVAQQALAAGRQVRPFGEPGFLSSTAGPHPAAQAGAEGVRAQGGQGPRAGHRRAGRRAAGRVEPGSTFDAVADLAYPLPVAVICRLLWGADRGRAAVQSRHRRCWRRD